MNTVEINRMIEYWEMDNRVSDKIAEGLEFVIGTDSKCCESEDADLFRNNMIKYFPNPADRARFLKHLTISAGSEESDDEDEDCGEMDFFLNEMLESIAQAIEQSPSLDDCRTLLTQLISD